MARASEVRQAEMQRLLSEQQASGLSVRRFARERGISAWTLYEWRRRFRRQEANAKRATFVQLEFKRAAICAPTISVELSSGMRVHVPSGFEERELRRLLGVLASC
jgi:transposase-like protein